jgi:hypothetical protein
VEQGLVRRAAVIATAAAAALVVGLALGQFWLGADGEDGTSAPSELVTVEAGLGTSVHAFGEPVTATVDVLVDTREIDLGSVTVQPIFEPYERVGPPRVTRTEHGALGQARFEYRLVCLKEGCDTAGAEGVNDFPSGRVRYRFADRPGYAFEAFDWPLLQVASRVADADIEQIRWRADDNTLPAVSYRVPPFWLALVLLLVACAAAAGAVLLARRLWWPKRDRQSESLDGAVARTPLEQAFVVALHAAAADEAPERRRALERVARELGALGRDDLAQQARALAWSPRVSTSDQVASLAALADVPALEAGQA